MRINVDRTLKISDVLTSLTIIVSVIALTMSWSKDRVVREKEQADRVRSAAAKTLTKLDRWQALQLSLFQELQPIFVETSEMLGADFHVIKIRDALWKTISVRRTLIASKILEEQIETAYVDLVAHFPVVRRVFLDTFAQLKAAEIQNMDAFLRGTQDDVLSFDGKHTTYMTAMLGNALRTTAAKHSEQFETHINQIMQEMRTFLFEILAKADRDILAATRRAPGR